LGPLKTGVLQQNLQLGDDPTYYDITTTATYEGLIVICISFSEVNYSGPPELLRLYHYDGSSWVDCTTLVDTENQIICGEVTSLSAFAVLLPEEPTLQNLVDALAYIVNSNPGTDMADKVEDVLAKARTAWDELSKTPPDEQAALGNLEGTVGDLEAAVADGLLDVEKGTQLMEYFASIARNLATDAVGQAIDSGGDPEKINEGQDYLNEGDALKASGSYKDAVAKYKDALSKAEGAL